MIIKFGDIEIEPYALNELDREESVYTFNFKVNVDEFKKFMDFLVSSDTNEKEDYFQVFIDDEPHTMRFGIVGYSEHKQFNKVHAVLVDKQVDENDNRKRFVHQQKEFNLTDSYLRQKLIIENLLGVLKENNLISEKQEQDIYNISDINIARERIKLFKVEDVDSYEV